MGSSMEQDRDCITLSKILRFLDLRDQEVLETGSSSSNGIRCGSLCMQGVRIKQSRNCQCHWEQGKHSCSRENWCTAWGNFDETNRCLWYCVWRFYVFTYCRWCERKTEKDQQHLNYMMLLPFHPMQSRHLKTRRYAKFEYQSNVGQIFERTNHKRNQRGILSNQTFYSSHPCSYMQRYKQNVWGRVIF